MTRRRRRGLTPAEHALWDQVAVRTRPLRPPEPPAADPAGGPVPFSPPPWPAPLPVPPLPKAPAGPRISFEIPTSPGQVTPGMDRRRHDKLRKGKLEPEARLDLHGLTAARAHAALERFITGAHAGGKRLVLVITGKGRVTDEHWNGPAGVGVLRQNVPHWLALPPLAAMVQQVAPAHRRHGGDGALYVSLRRRR